MKKSLYGFALSVMLLAVFGAGQVFAGDRDRKEQMQIIVVKKKERDKSGNGENKRTRPGDRQP